MNVHTPRTPARTVALAIVAAVTTVGLIVGLVASRGPALLAVLPVPVAEPHWDSGRTVLDLARVEVPLVLEGDVPVVHAWVDGRGPYRFAVDTGCSFPVALDDGLVEELGLPIVGTTDNTDGAGNVELRDLATVTALDLGGVRFADLRTLVDDFETFTGQTADFDGLIGFPLFAELLTTIDYDARRLVFERGALDPDGDHVVAFVDWYGVPHVPFTIGDQTLQVLIDTGSPLSLVLPWPARDRFGFEGELHRAGSVRTIYAELDWWQGALGEPCRVAGHRLGRLDAHFFEPSVESALGGALLRDKRIVIDAPNGLVALR